MCSIIGFCSDCVDEAAFWRAFDKTKSRGPDASRVQPLERGVLGFHRLAIMGLTDEGMQPFARGADYLVCNGEVYGFRALREQLSAKYEFVSQSDCEILLPLYREHGYAMFGQLDAEFALIIYDGKTKSLVAARDPIGIRPLYYGYLADGEIAFASEPKNLIDLCEWVMPFPPGHYYAEGNFHCYRNISRAEQYHTGALDEICTGIRQRLIAGIEKRLDADAPVGFLLSGGLDSSLVCAVSARLLDRPLRTFAIGMDSDAIDLKYAREVAAYIGSEHTEIFMTRAEVLATLDTVIQTLGTYDITTIRASMGMYLICKAIHEQTDVKVLLTGEISDELFGYKYTDFAPSPAEFQQEAQKRVRELHMYDVLRADRCISANAIEARVPFGDLDFVEYVMSIDPFLKSNRYGMGKYLLRKAFEGDWLPESILYREKAAFSDAVGHSMVDDLKEYAQGLYTDTEFVDRAAKYTHATPFTKESLLYREIFETYYPGQSEMITNFWMPNQSWAGCDVTDPSARALANYGKSGL